jgi:3-ketosteroid 9alpha-monooxygenase subunit A
LGADLGVGGTVVGDTVRCPFHAWRFGPDGLCVETPYADKIPPTGDRVRSWPVRERNGLIFVWHDWAGPDSEPDWEIPVLQEHGASEWTDWKRALLHIDTDPREVLENVADRAHFGPVHSTNITHFENEFVDHTATQFNRGVAYPKGGGKDEFELTATYFGPAYQITWMEGVLSSRLLLCHTPVRPGRIDLRFGAMLKLVKGDQALTESFAEHYSANLDKGFREDIAIWENKVWRDRPVLCDGDGAIMKLRKWYRAFYAPDA